MTFLNDTGIPAEQIRRLLEAARQYVLEHLEASRFVRVTVVWTKKGNLYYFPISEDVYHGDYLELEKHIQTLVAAGDIEVQLTFSLPHPSQITGKVMQPILNCWYFNYRLAQLRPQNLECPVLLWGTAGQNGAEALYILKRLREHLPPDVKMDL